MHWGGNTVKNVLDFEKKKKNCHVESNVEAKYLLPGLPRKHSFMKKKKLTDQDQCPEGHP